MAFCQPLQYMDAFTHAVANLEARLSIEKEWADEFGSDGMLLLEEILSNVAPEANNAIINSFLKDILFRIKTEDSDLTHWTLADYLAQCKQYHCDAKPQLTQAALAFGSSRKEAKKRTSPKILSDFFHWAPPPSATAQEDRPPTKVSSSKESTTKPVGLQPPPPPSQTHKSRLMALGEILSDGFRRAALARNRNKISAVNSIIAQLKEEDEGSILSKGHLKSCVTGAQEMENMLFKQGGITRVLATLNRFHQRPAIREADRAGRVDDVALAGSNSIYHESKEEKLNRLVIGALKGFFEMFNTNKGPRTSEDQNTVDVALAAITSPDEMKSARLGRKLAAATGVTYRHLKRAATIRADLQDKDSAHWVRAGKQTTVFECNSRRCETSYHRVASF